MLLIWLGALLIVAGVLFTAAKGNWLGRFRGESHQFSGTGFGLKSNWPGLAMIGLGAVLMLARAFFP
ncbi:MAG TPA: hypothetical protein VF744_16155 [Beijerinckiaceae bacterium]|jgi:hypothetical protein